jgi:catechol 2,3-dioxygenase-like lactoylglutathione lyase family enzyme
MTLQTNGLSHLALRVTDLARARRFYVDTLGIQQTHADLHRLERSKHVGTREQGSGPARH